MLPARTATAYLQLAHRAFFIVCWLPTPADSVAVTVCAALTPQPTETTMAVIRSHEDFLGLVTAATVSLCKTLPAVEA